MLLDQVKNLMRLLDASGDCVDLKNIKFVYPLEILPLAALIDKNHLKIVWPEDDECRQYLEYFKFPKGLSKYSHKSDKYIPIYNFETSSKSFESIKTRFDITSNLVNVFLKNIGDYKGIRNALEALSIDEMISNIEEHAVSPKAWIHAQYYRTKRYLDICIVDTGITIKGSYDKHNIATTSDTQAIINALKGVSAKKEGRGSGIRTFIKIITEGLTGEVVIISGNALAYASSSKPLLYRLKQRWDGTIIGLRVPNQKNNIDYSNYIV